MVELKDVDWKQFGLENSPFIVAFLKGMKTLTETKFNSENDRNIIENEKFKDAILKMDAVSDIFLIPYLLREGVKKK